MAISRAKKEATVEKLQGVVNSAKNIVFVHFKDVTVEEINDLRTACAEENVGYTVARKKLIAKAFENGPVTGEFPTLDGEIAVAYSEDELAAAQVIGSQAKILKDKVQIVGGVFESNFVSEDKMKDIASIPPVKVLYAQFLTVIRGPIQGCVSVLGQVAEKKN